MYDPLLDEVELIETNPNYALLVRLQTRGNETTVSLRHLAPRGDERLYSENTSGVDDREALD